MLINLKLLRIAFIFLLNIAEYEIFSASKYEHAKLLLVFSCLLTEKISCSAQHEKSFITSGSDQDLKTVYFSMSKKYSRGKRNIQFN